MSCSAGRVDGGEDLAGQHAAQLGVAELADEPHRLSSTRPGVDVSLVVPVAVGDVVLVHAGVALTRCSYSAPMPISSSSVGAASASSILEIRESDMDEDPVAGSDVVEQPDVHRALHAR